jgi:hypothetical protein
VVSVVAQLIRDVKERNMLDVIPIVNPRILILLTITSFLKLRRATLTIFPSMAIGFMGNLLNDFLFFLRPIFRKDNTASHRYSSEAFVLPLASGREL